MRKIFTVLFCGLMISAFAQESYTAKKVSAEWKPVIDGNLDAVWTDANLDIRALEKVPETGGAVHPNITVPEPAEDDYYAEFGMLWDENGLYILFRVVDDIIKIEDDYYTDNAIDADMWWTDDNINILFSKDLVNNVFTQWEFAYQPGVDQEEKLSSDDWANPAKIATELVESAWHQDGDVWTLETFISWEAFADGTATITEGMDIMVEMRARDDDDDGAWESMFQWSTTNYDIENDGQGFGTVTLSAEEIEVIIVNPSTVSIAHDVNLFPNPATANAKLQYHMSEAGNVGIKVYNMAGIEVINVMNEFVGEGLQETNINTQNLTSGIYLVTLTTGGISEKVYLLKR